MVRQYSFRWLKGALGPHTTIAGYVISALLLSVNAQAADTQNNIQPAKLFANLTDNCPTPDAFAIAPDGSLTLSCPNFANNKLQGELLSIAPNGEVAHLATIPTLNLTRKANPMGIAYDDNGDLYVADSRGIKHGRILKMSFDKNKLLNTEVIASGINPNGLRYRDGAIYITQLNMPNVKSSKNISAIYRFNASDRNVKVANTLDDEQLIFSIETQNPSIGFGLDGIAFSPNGTLFAANLGDSEVYQLTQDKHGNVTEHHLYASLPNDTRIDGLAFDDEGNLYLAGFGLNQIFKITEQQQVIKLADYSDNDGSNGQIDQPADLIVYQDKLVISNFDLMTNHGLRNSEHSKPYTLSYIELK